MPFIRVEPRSPPVSKRVAKAFAEILELLCEKNRPNNFLERTEKALPLKMTLGYPSMKTNNFLFLLVFSSPSLFASFCVHKTVKVSRVQGKTAILQQEKQEVLPNVEITLYRKVGSDYFEIKKVISDEKGSFVFSNVSPGDYWIAAKTVGFKLEMRKLKVTKKWFFKKGYGLTLILDVAKVGECLGDIQREVWP